METELPTLMELDSTEPADFSQPPQRYSNLERIRTLSVVSGEASGWSSSSSRSARSSYYSSSMSSNASGGPHNHRYAPYSNSSPRPVVITLDLHGARDIARQMARDGFVAKLIGEFGREPGSTLERWFSELDVGWVLRSAAAADKEQSELGLDDLVRRWTRGYTVMVEALNATRTQTDKVGGVAVMECDQELEDDLRLQVARFVEATVSKMLAFADALAADNTWRPIDNLSGLMGLYSCIFKCRVPILIHALSDSEEQCLARKVDGAFRITMSNLCTAILKMAKDAEAVTPVLSGWDSWENFKQNAEIHKATRLIVDYARLFWEYKGLLHIILLSKRDPHLDDRWSQVPITMIKQMVINLEDQLEKKSKSFSDPSLRYLFLLNNSYFVREDFLEPGNCVYILTLKFMQYQEKYMLASWEPVMCCLQDKMPLWFPKHSLQLARFKSEFQKTCRRQKLWKVPNPRLRQKLRKAIVDKVIIGYKRYLEDHPELEKCSSDLHDMEDMVNVLFEG
ncbi:exocyst complex component EXO70B2-like [Oryza glaberrima]|nr:exocyst complex component EXO70B2-like [Oryza glaberrima]